MYVKRLMESFDPSSSQRRPDGLGAVLLIAWVLVTGKVGQLLSLSGLQWRWVLLTGVLLTGYVGPGMRARTRPGGGRDRRAGVRRRDHRAARRHRGTASINAPALLLVAAGCGGHRLDVAAQPPRRAVSSA